MQARLARLLLPALLLLSGATGCHKVDGPPPPLTLEQLPGALENAFAKAKPEARESVNSVLTALGDKDYPKALLMLQKASALPGFNKAQANVVAAGLLTINTALQEAQNQGDQNAAQTLQLYHNTK